MEAEAPTSTFFKSKKMPEQGLLKIDSEESSITMKLERNGPKLR